MANSLLDFVMSLVRDPDAAARYAVDPAQAIADADLTDVTSADVQNLIPVVAESLSMTTPSYNSDAFGAASMDNVWASGAATPAFEAFEAFAEHLPDLVTSETHAVVTDVADHMGTDLDALPGGDLLDTDGPLQLDEPAIHDPVSDDWVPPAPDPHPVDPSPGFDFFD